MVDEPEYITVLEGPTPEFEGTPSLWLPAVYEGPVEGAVARCELRTMNGDDIVARCRAAWHDGRMVVLDFPDDLRMRQEVDVVGMRLRDVEEGKVLTLWVRWPMDEDEDDDEEEEEEYDGFDDDYGFDSYEDYD